MDTLASFFGDNERKTNNLLVKALYFSIAIFLIVIIASVTGLFGELNNTYVVCLCLFDITIVLFFIPIMRKKAEAKSLKYILISIICIQNLSLAVIPNMRMYISFLLPPLVSCFYVNDKFTLATCVISAITFEISIAVRSFIHDGEMFETIPRLSYFLAYGIGGLIEYSMYCYVLFYLTRTTFQSLMHSFLRRKRLGQIHTVILEGFANIVESKDKSTAEHISRTSGYVSIICEQLKKKGLYPDQVNDETIPVMIRAAPFHDLGKISVPDDILNKPGKLDDKEWKVIQRHPAEGAQFIQHNFQVLGDEDFMKTASEMALCHHERIDGTGYPYKLLEEEIPVDARIMAAADIFDALVSKRAYKKPFTIEEAFSVLRELSGTTLDPVIVDCLIEARDAVEKTMKGEKS